MTFQPPHILSRVAVPDGTEQHFNGTVILNEEDWTDPTLATALGVVISIVLTLGVEAAIRYLQAEGLPAELTEETRRILEEHGITGVRSWFEELIGPELFEIVTVRATTDWPGPTQPVTWRSWIPYTPDTVQTTPHQSVGPKTHVGNETVFREARIAEGPDGEPSVTRPSFFPDSQRDVRSHALRPAVVGRPPQRLCRSPRRRPG